MGTKKRLHSDQRGRRRRRRGRRRKTSVSNKTHTSAKMNSKMATVFLVLLVVVALIDRCSSKPQCGLRWRGPCRRAYNRASKDAKREAYNAFDADKFENDATSVEETKEMTNDVAKLEAELLDIIKETKDYKLMN